MDRRNILNIFRKRALALDLAFRLAAVTTVIIVLLGASYYFVSVKQAERNLSQQATRRIEELADVLAIPVWNLDDASVEQIAKVYLGTENVVAVHVLDDAGNIIYDSPANEENTIVETRPIIYNQKNVGQVEIEVSTKQVRDLRQNIMLLVFIIVVAVALAILVATWALLQRYLELPLSTLTEGINSFARGDYSQRLNPMAQQEFNTIATQFNTMAGQIQARDQVMEQRVAERTSSLILAADVGRSVSQVRELHLMLKDAVELIRERFDLYYVQVTLKNPVQNDLLLEAGTGEIGAELFGQRFRLPIDAHSINGRAALEKHPIIISDTANSTAFLPHPLLSDTRSEMAVPLMAGETVLGVLDLQSNTPGALDQDILPAFEALAGQLTSAIQNANLLAQTEQARLELETQSRHLVRQGWEEHLDAIHRPEQTGFVFENNQVTPLADTVDLQVGDKVNAITAPIAITGEALGALVVELDAQQQSTQNTELINIVAHQVAQQIENLRLLESAERYRSEAEAAARQNTIEGWQKYVASRGEELGYLYDTKEVQLLDKSQSSEAADLTIPVKASEETVAELEVLGLDTGDSDAVELASAVADRLGAHIENLRLLEETKRSQLELNQRASQLAAVAEISYVSARELDIQKLLESVVQLTQRKFGFYHTHVFLYHEQSNELRIAACGWKESEGREGAHATTFISLTQERSLVSHAARSRQPVIVDNVRSEPGWQPDPLLPEVASEMAVPLLIGDQLLGVLDVQSDRPQAFTAEDASIQTMLASQVATAVQNARSFAQAQQQAERESTLNIINQKIQSATNVEAVLQIAARELGHVLGAARIKASIGGSTPQDGSDPAGGNQPISSVEE